MAMIEVDFDVFKALTSRRASEDVSYNDVLRQLLGLSKNKARATQAAPQGEDWISKGIRFPHGTEFRANYKGRPYSARIEDGALVLEGKNYNSPSAAAVSITGNPVNGWLFWECRLPGKSAWQSLKVLRNK